MKVVRKIPSNIQRRPWFMGCLKNGKLVKELGVTANDGIRVIQFTDKEVKKIFS